MEHADTLSRHITRLIACARPNVDHGGIATMRACRNNTTSGSQQYGQVFVLPYVQLLIFPPLRWCTMGIVNILQFLLADLPQAIYETANTTFIAELVRSNFLVNLFGIMALLVHFSASRRPHENCCDTARVHASPHPVVTGPAGATAEKARDTARVVARKRLNTLRRNA